MVEYTIRKGVFYVFIDGEVFMTTENTTDAEGLLVALSLLKAKRNSAANG